MLAWRINVSRRAHESHYNSREQLFRFALQKDYLGNISKLVVPPCISFRISTAEIICELKKKKVAKPRAHNMRPAQ